MNLVATLRRVFRIGCLALSVLAAAAVCWIWLSALGDIPGAEGARGVACVSAVLLAVDLAAMIVVLALAELSRAKS